MSRTAILALLLATLGSFFAAATAQPLPPVERLSTEGPIQYVGPDTYILLDSEGRGQPVLGMTYEEFMAAWRESQQLESQVTEPRFTIDEVRFAGETRPDHAELDVEVTIRLLTNTEIEVPLGMAKGILREAPQWDDRQDRPDDAEDRVATASETSRLSFVPERGGFVASLQGQPGETRRLALRLLVPLARNANETSLALNLPRALVSKLSLRVPARLDAVTANGDSLLTREESAEGDTRLSVAGLAGEFRLTWTTMEPRRPELATVLSATGAIAVSIDGHSIRSDARLTIRSFGGSFDRFRVRLPPGAQLLQPERGNDAAAAAPNYRINVEDRASERGRSTTPLGDDRQVVVIELAERQAGPVEIQLATEQPLGLPGTDSSVELAGFEVLGAVRQFGDVALNVADDWQARWSIGPHVRQVERGIATAKIAAGDPGDRPASTTRGLVSTAAFQYDRAPWSLRVRVVERPFRVQVTPDYVLEVDANEARLRVALTYQVPGARALEFHVQLRGWELTPEPIESEGLVDRDAVQVTGDGLLILPLTQASPRRAEIAFVLRRTLASPVGPGKVGAPISAGRVELPLPLPDADAVAAADLTVLAAPGSELKLDPSRSRGLSPTPVTEETPFATTGVDGRQPYRYRALLPDAVFAAVRTLRPRVVDIDVATDLAIDANRIVANQVVNYHVRNQPLAQLVFDLPEEWTLVDDQVAIAPSSSIARSEKSDREQPPSDQFVFVAAEHRGATNPSAQSQIRVALPQPRLGKFQAQLTFVMKRPAELSLSESMQLALVRPIGGQIIGHHVRVSGSATVAAAFDSAFDDSTWQPTTPPPSGSPLELIGDGNESTLPIVLRQIDPNRQQLTSVERIWLQTWQAGNKVQERAVFRFRAAGSTALVELPPGVSSQEVEVVVDGRLANVAARDEGRVAVDLSEYTADDSQDHAERPHSLELRYSRPVPTSQLARQTYTPPQLAGTTSFGQVYWQWILPAGVHIVQTPRLLTPVDQWQWFGAFWGRQPRLGQPELEDWVGAAHSEFVPSSHQTNYVFSGMAPVASIEVLTAPRWLVVLVASGAVLAVACAWVYFPNAHRPWIGLFLAITVAAVAATFPVPAVLVGQASLVGWFLAVLVVGLRSWLGRPPRQQPLATGSTQLRLRASSRGDSYATPPIEPVTGRTPATPISVPETD